MKGSSEAMAIQIECVSSCVRLTREEVGAVGSPRHRRPVVSAEQEDRPIAREVDEDPKQDPAGWSAGRGSIPAEHVSDGVGVDWKATEAVGRATG